MSLGAGLLLSTILLIVVWQIDKRDAWRPARKMSLWFAAAFVVIGILAYVYFGWWPDLEARKARAKEIDGVRNPTDLRYWGVSPDMSKNEVRYLKGNPSQIIPAGRADAAGSVDESEERWLYSFGESPRDYVYDIFWNTATSKIQAIVCHGNDPANCDRLAGIGPGDDEATVRATLGKPDEDRPPDETGQKMLAYGTGPKRVFILLSRSTVDSLVFARMASTAKSK